MYIWIYGTTGVYKMKLLLLYLLHRWGANQQVIYFSLLGKLAVKKNTRMFIMTQWSVRC